MMITGNEVKRKISSHNLSLLPICDWHKAREYQPSELSIATRFDVMAKYIYAKQRMIGGGLRWATDIYREHLRCFGYYDEGDGAGKKGFDNYIKAFNDLLDSISKNGFQENMGYVPVDKKGTIIDGSHRLATCLFYDKPIWVIEFDTEAKSYDYKYFLTHGLDIEVADAMAHEFIKLSRNAYVAVVFPIADSRLADIRAILEKYGSIVYEKNVMLNKIGRRNIIKILYNGEAWLGKTGELTKGLLHHSESRFGGSRSAHFIFIICDDHTKIVEAKEMVRALFDFNKDPIHINDTHDNTLRIAEAILNRNSLAYLNNVPVDICSYGFRERLESFRGLIHRFGSDKEDYCIDGSSVLEVYGIRPAKDLDYLHNSKNPISNDGDMISCHNNIAHYYSVPTAELIYNPEYHFYKDGLKFISLNVLKKMKFTRREGKDLKDVNLINKHQRTNSGYILLFYKYYRMDLSLIGINFSNYLYYVLKKQIPVQLYPFLRKIYRLSKKLTKIEV